MSEKRGIWKKRKYLGPVWPADVWPADDIPFDSIFTYFQYSLIHDLAHNALTYKTVCDNNGKFCKWVDFDLKWVVSAKLQTIEQQLSWTASLLSQGSNLRGSQFECCNSRQIRVYSSFVNLKFHRYVSSWQKHQVLIKSQEA